MAEPTPDAAPAENAGTEAPTTNQEQAPAPEQTPEQPAQPTISEEDMKALEFIKSNGGLDKVKQTISARTTQKAPEATETPKPVENTTQASEAPQKPNTEQIQQIPAGYQTMQEFMVEQYYGTLANKPEYAPIADQIRSGEIFKEMAKFNIVPVTKDGMINQKQVNDFLTLYAKTVPAPAPANPMTSTPTVEYVNVGKEITSRADAMKVMSQKGHPMHDAALKFMADQINKK